jgi:hypothetical protein
LGNKLTNSGEGVGRIKIPSPPRCGAIVGFPAKTGSTTAEGLAERKKLLPEIHLAGSLVKVVNGCVITSVLNTTEKEVNITEPVVMVIKVDSGDPWIPDRKDRAERDKSRYDRVLNKLRMAHRNTEEDIPWRNVSNIRMYFFF